MTKPAVTRIFGRRATLKRSFGLLSDFRHEQSAPDIFYGALARDSVELISDLHEGHTGRSLDGLTVLDVGGGPGYFAEVFQAAGARYIPVEPDPSEMHAAGLTVGGAVRGSGLALPFLDSSVDICFSSNVAEHVSEPWLMAEEMLRVTKPGGLMVLSYTLWWGPFGGHETGPWHALGASTQPSGTYARPDANRRTDSGCRCSKSAPRTAYAGPVEPARARCSPRSRATTVVGVVDVRVPGLREFLVSNLVVVLEKR